MTSMALPGGADAPRPRRRRSRSFVPLLPALALLAIFFVGPVVGLLLRSIMDPDLTLANYAEVFGSSTYLRVFGNTFLVAGLVTAVTLLLAFPVSWFLAVAPRRWAALLFAVVILSMWTNLLTRTYAWMVLLQRTGIINKALMGLGLIHEPLALVNNLIGVTVGMTYIMLPFMVLPLQGTMRSLDPNVLRAASLCGASRFQVFARIFLPLVASGIGSGVLMVFVMSLGYYVTPALLGGTANMMLAELIAQLVQSLLKWGLAGAAAVVLLAVSLGLYALQLRFFGFGPAREAE